MTQLNDDGDYRAAFDKLSLEATKLRNLRELLALKLANRCDPRDVSEVTNQMEHTQSELLQLMLKVENFAGEVIEGRCKLNLPS